MKNIFKKIVAIVCALTLCVGTIQVIAAEGDHFYTELGAVKSTDSSRPNQAFIIESTDTDGMEYDSVNWSIIVTADTSTDVTSGIYLNGILVPNALMKKFDTKSYYVEGFGAADEGDVLTIKGTFRSTHGELITFSNIATYQWVESEQTWVVYERTNYFGELTTVHPDYESNAAALGVYTTDQKPSDGWDTPLKALNENSGVYINGNRISNAQMKKTGNSYYYVEQFGTVNEGDVLTIKGLFGADAQDNSVTLVQADFQWVNGSWEQFGKVNYWGELTTITGANQSNVLEVSTTDKKPGDGWETPIKALNENSGIYINGNRISNAQMKKPGDSGYYVEQFGTASEGDVLTIKGVFGSDAQGRTVTLKQADFQWLNGSWKRFDKANYIGQLTALADDASDSGFYATSIDKKTPDSDWNTPLTAKNKNSGIFLNGAQKDSACLKKLTIEKYFIGDFDQANVGDILTVKGLFGKEGHDETVCIPETHFLWDGNVWTNYTIVDFEGELSYVGSDASATHTYLMTTDKKPISTWDVRFTAQDLSSGVYVNGTKMSGAYFQKVGGQCYFTNFGTLGEGDVVTIKGVFGSQDVIGTITFEEATFQFVNGAWTHYGKVNYLSEVSVSNIDVKANGLYVNTTDGKSHDDKWNTVLTAKNNNSGIYINGEKMDGQMKKYAANAYYLEGFKANEGDVLTVRGLFGNDTETDSVTISEAKFQFEGNIWIQITDGMKYEVGNVWLDTGKQNTEVFLYLGGTSAVHESYADNYGWNVSVGTTGIYKNGEPCTATMKNVNTDAWFVDFGGANIKAGDKITIKGTFGHNESYAKISEYNLWYTNNNGWTVMYGDATGDGELNSLDIMRMKRYLAGQDVTIDPTGANANGQDGINNDDRLELFKFILDGVKGIVNGNYIIE